MIGYWILVFDVVSTTFTFLLSMKMGWQHQTTLQRGGAYY